MPHQIAAEDPFRLNALVGRAELSAEPESEANAHIEHIAGVAGWINLVDVDEVIAHAAAAGDAVIPGLKLVEVIAGLGEVTPTRIRQRPLGQQARGQLVLGAVAAAGAQRVSAVEVISIVASIDRGVEREYEVGGFAVAFGGGEAELEFGVPARPRIGRRCRRRRRGWRGVRLGLPGITNTLVRRRRRRWREIVHALHRLGRNLQATENRVIEHQPLGGALDDLTAQHLARNQLDPVRERDTGRKQRKQHNPLSHDWSSQVG